MAFASRYVKVVNPDFHQQAAIFSKNNYVRVNGCPGSGKTAVLRSKMVHLVRTGAACAEEVAVFVASPAAAATFAERLDFAPKIGTFSSFGCEVLRRHIQKLPGYTKAFTVLSEGERKRLTRQHLPKFVSAVDEGCFYRFVSSCKARSLYPFSEDANGRQALEAEAKQLPFDGFKAFEGYQTALNANNAVDLDDLVALPMLIAKRDASCSLFLKQFKHVLVDDFQCLSPAERNWLRFLASMGSTLTLAGDSQTTFEPPLEASAILPKNEVFFELNLGRNYRSTKTITSFANDFHRKRNSDSADMLVGSLREDFSIEALRFPNYEAEAITIVETILKMIRGGERPSDIAILFRNNADMLLYEDACLRQEVPYRLFGDSLWNRPEVLEAVAYLQLTLNPQNALALDSVANPQTNDLSQKSLKRVANFMAEGRLDAMQVAQQKDLLDSMPNQSAKGFLALVDTLRNLQEASRRMGLLEFIEHMFEASGLLAACKNYPDALLSRRKLDGLDRVLLAAEAFERGVRNQENHGTALLFRFVEAVALRAVVDVPFASSPAVSLMAIPDSVGLEFANLFIVGLEENVFPCLEAIGRNELNEEERLFYVAATRARRRLFLSTSKRRLLGNRLKKMLLSRFVREANERHLLITDYEPSLQGAGQGK